ncbi:MAG: hypothetical protein JWP29_3892 [Rhodoferax sp.]|nr:hypothetical protein [Rhodoferax sp.]
MRICHQKPATSLPMRRAVLASTGAWLLGPALGQERPADIDIVTDQWPRFVNKDVSGLFIDVIRMIFDRQGVQAKFRIFPYARTVQMVKEKRADAWIGSHERQYDFPLYPKWPFHMSREMVLFKKDAPAPFKSVESLRDKRVGWMRNFNLDRYINVPIKLTEVDSFASGIQMLDAGRIDFLIHPRLLLDDAVQGAGTDLSKYEVTVGLRLGLFLAFADTARGAALRNLWDAEMDTLHAAEAFKALFKKYGVEPPFP